MANVVIAFTTILLREHGYNRSLYAAAQIAHFTRYALKLRLSYRIKYLPITEQPNRALLRLDGVKRSKAKGRNEIQRKY